jgi:ketosteroid isomerase-like protein
MNVRYTWRLPLIMATAFSVLPSVFPAIALAQGAEDQVKAANQAIIAAGLRGDQQGFASLVADDLQWIRATGEVVGKAEYTKTINPGIANSQRTFTEESVAVYGDVALLVCRSDYIRQGQKHAERVLRAFIRRDRQWLLLRHAATPLAP